MSATVADIRATIVDALRDAEAAAELDPALLLAFEGGTGDVDLAALELDSLMRMELLVALEMEHGAVVTPRTLSELASLDQLVECVLAGGDVVTGAPGSDDPVTGALGSDDPVTDDPFTDDAVPETRGAPDPPVDAVTNTDASGADLPRVVRLFRRAFAGSNTVAQLDRLLVRLEGRIAPLDLAALCRHRRDLLPAAVAPAIEGELQRRLEALERAVSAEGDVERFEITRPSPALLHAAAPGDGRARALLVCFSVVGGRKLFVPLPTFLQSVDASRFEVLLVTDPHATAFRGGVPGLGVDVHEVVRSLAEHPLVAGRSSVRVLGCSAGAFPAQLLGRRIGAELTLAASGRFPSERHLGTLASMYGSCVAAALRAPRARVLFAHGTAKRRDAAYARRLARLTFARRVEVSLAGRAIEHNLFEPLADAGRLGAFLERTLLAPLDDLDRAPRRSAIVLDAR